MLKDGEKREKKLMLIISGDGAAYAVEYTDADAYDVADADDAGDADDISDHTSYWSFFYTHILGPKYFTLKSA